MAALFGFTGLFAQAQGAVDHVTEERGSTLEYLQMQDILDTTIYPVQRGELFKRLGGRKRLRQYAALSMKKEGKLTYLIDYALSDNGSDVGFFLIEFIEDQEPKGDGSDSVLSAQYYFQSATGVRFIPEPRKQVKRANQPPRTPVSGTPAASASAKATADKGAPVAPPPGAAGR